MARGAMVADGRGGWGQGWSWWRPDNGRGVRVVPRQGLGDYGSPLPAGPHGSPEQVTECTGMAVGGHGLSGGSAVDAATLARRTSLDQRDGSEGAGKVGRLGPASRAGAHVQL